MEAQFYTANRTIAAELFPKTVWSQRPLECQLGE
jgi:hypothetical protein